MCALFAFQIAASTDSVPSEKISCVISSVDISSKFEQIEHANRHGESQDSQEILRCKLQLVCLHQQRQLSSTD